MHAVCMLFFRQLPHLLHFFLMPLLSCCLLFHYQVYPKRCNNVFRIVEGLFVLLKVFLVTLVNLKNSHSRHAAPSQEATQ